MTFLEFEPNCQGIIIRKCHHALSHGKNFPYIHSKSAIVYLNRLFEQFDL